jgi:ABC-type uncharacterized transport system permease subunit
MTELLTRNENALLMVSVAAYLAGMLLLWAHLFFRADDASRASEAWHRAAAHWGRVALGAGALTHALSLGGQGAAVFAVRAGVAGLFGWILAVTYLLFARQVGRAMLGAFVAPVVFLTALYSLHAPALHRLAPAAQLETQWLVVHVCIILIAYVALSLAFASALLYLLQEGLLKRKKLSGLWLRLPPLQLADELIYRATSFGLAMLTLGMLTGVAMMHKQSEGYALLADPKAIFTLVTWLTFALYLVARWWLGWRGRRTNLVVIYGFVLLVISFLVVPHVLSTVVS